MRSSFAAAWASCWTSARERSKLLSNEERSSNERVPAYDRHGAAGRLCVESAGAWRRIGIGARRSDWRLSPHHGGWFAEDAAGYSGGTHGARRGGRPIEATA